MLYLKKKNISFTFNSHL